MSAIRNLLEWETMAQSEIAGGPRFTLFDQYLYVSSLLWLPFLFWRARFRSSC